MTLFLGTLYRRVRIRKNVGASVDLVEPSPRACSPWPRTYRGEDTHHSSGGVRCPHRPFCERFSNKIRVSNEKITGPSSNIRRGFGASEVVVVVKSVPKTGGGGGKHCALGESNNERRYAYGALRETSLGRINNKRVRTVRVRKHRVVGLLKRVPNTAHTKMAPNRRFDSV